MIPPDSVYLHSSSRSHSHSLSGPTEWAKELLKERQENAAKLKRLQGKLSSTKSYTNQQPHAVVPYFRFAGNKRPWRLMNMKNVCINLWKVRCYLWSGRNIFFLLRNMDGTQSLVTPLIHLPATQMTKRKFIKL